jgi:mono/diheme cytochrome c family protein
MSRLPALFCALLVAGLAAGAWTLHQIPQPARLTSWPLVAHMPAFGGALTPSQIEDLTEYVIALAGAPSDPNAVIRAAPLWQTRCAVCHGLGGEGAEILGTPDFTRGQFRYARSPQDIRQQIWRGGDGRGPVREASAARLPAAPNRAQDR